MAKDLDTAQSLIHGDIFPALNAYGRSLVPTLGRSPLADVEYSLPEGFLKELEAEYDVTPLPAVAPTTLRKTSYAQAARKATQSATFPQSNPRQSSSSQPAVSPPHQKTSTEKLSPLS